MNWIDLITALATALLTGGGVSTFLYFTENKRRAAAVAKQEEVRVDLSEVDVDAKRQEMTSQFMEEIKKFYSDVMEQQRKLFSEQLIGKDREIKELRVRLDKIEHRLEENERRDSKKDYIIRKSYGCSLIGKPTDCPVLAKYQECDLAKDSKIERLKSIK